MRGYAKFRLILLGILLAVVVTTLAGSGFAQTTTAPAPAANAPTNAPKQGLLSLILEHPDVIFFTIAILSVTGLALIIQGFIKTRESVFMPESSTAAIKDLIAERRFKDLIDFTETDPSFVSKVLNPALKRAPSFQAMKESMETAVAESTAEQFRRIEYLNIIGNLGPLLGLLGTVLGMIYAFQDVSRQEGGAKVQDLAFGISTALCHTFLGLFLAIPCLAAFGWLRTRVDKLTIRGALVAEEILLMIKPNEARPAAGTTSSSHAPTPGVIPPPPPRPTAAFHQ
jgi:biopolymer transport protein ExbB